MVNVPAVRRVIASIRGELPETQNLGFNMASYIYRSDEDMPDHSGRDLEWVGCICGHTYILEIGCSFQQAMDEEPEEIEEIAQLSLGLTREQADALFFDLPDHLRLAFIPTDYVVRTLERLIETGEVCWIEEEPYVVAA